MVSIEYILLIGSVLILISIAIARMSDNLGVPALLLFLVIGMFAGSEGPGGIYFDDAQMAQSVGIIALVLILFAGGLDTRWDEVKPVVWQAFSLATLGVFLTAALVGFFVHQVLGLPLLQGLLLGAVISSTDAAAVFSVLRSKNINLQGKLKPLLELESGSNDPMAVFLTIGLLQIITLPDSSIWDLLPLFFLQMIIGSIAGLLLGRFMVMVINAINLQYQGLYAVLTFAWVSLIYSGTTLVGGSGFLAVYIAGLISGNSDFIQKRSLTRFFDGLAWLSQIGMFLTLGLLVFPSRLVPVIGSGLSISIFLMLIARPISVFISLARTRLHWREKVFVSWVGLRGAVPVILATFVLLAKLPQSDTIFNVVFFITISSALLQGWSIPLVARLLRVTGHATPRGSVPLEIAPDASINAELVDFIVPYNSDVIGKSIVELGLPDNSLIVLMSRNDRYIVPSGSTILQEGDTLLILVNQDNVHEVRRILSVIKTAQDL